MTGVLVIQMDRLNVVQCNVGMDVSTETLVAQVRTEPNQKGELLATWTITKPNGGADGEIVLTLTAAQLSTITDKRGYTDIKRVTASGDLPVFAKPLEIEFRGTVTA